MSKIWYCTVTLEKVYIIYPVRLAKIYKQYTNNEIGHEKYIKSRPIKNKDANIYKENSGKKFWIKYTMSRQISK